MHIKNILIIAEFLALAIFIIPVFQNILNPGNIAGMLVCIVLLLATIFYKRLFNFISTMWGHNVGKITLIFAGVILLSGIIYITTITAFMVSAQLDEPDAPQAVVVLGCKVRGNKPSRMLKRRLNAAAEYLKDNKDIVCVVSGGKGDDELISEAEAMKAYLVECDIEADRIIKEDKSVNTYENIKNSVELIGIDSGEIAIVTDGFHQYRAGYIAKKMGFDAAAVNAERTLNSTLIAPTYYVREYMAVVNEYIKKYK